ncbi:MAG: putative lipid II flippase FtsW [Lachnospiraceae bacterium]
MSRTPRKQIKKNNYFDYTLLFIILFLVAFGLVMLYSTSSYNARIKFSDPAFYFKKQLVATMIGLVGMTFFAKVDYRVWKKLAVLIYLVSVALGIAVLVAGSSFNGSQRWLKIGPISFQPSEFAKLAIIIFLATLVSRMPQKMSSIKNILKVLLLAALVIVPVAFSNLSTAIIIAGISIGLIFVASTKYLQFIIMGIIAFVGGAGFIFFESYRMDRIKIWFHPENFEKGYQTLQGLYAIGSGGIFGKGLGESMQKLGFVPEPQNDMIFSVICEELGLFGAICVILLFLLMIWRFMIIANNAQDLFGSLVVVGIMIHISIQVILNIAVVTNTIPNTGITLPFVSYGGTSMLFLLSEMGLALSVSRGIQIDPEQVKP